MMSAAVAVIGLLPTFEGNGDAVEDGLPAAKPGADPALLDEARTLHRHAQFMWDFISSSNSMGFHNPDEALRILQNATDLARQAQMKASQAANDPALLKTGVYDSLNPKPTPAP
jgi:formate-dependent nitrite reductase cytochrome c552 subunit